MTATGTVGVNWDNVGGLEGFGYENTDDIFANLSESFNNKLRLNTTFWKVKVSRKFLVKDFIWDEGQNELFRTLIGGRLN